MKEKRKRNENEENEEGNSDMNKDHLNEKNNQVNENMIQEYLSLTPKIVQDYFVEREQRGEDLETSWSISKFSPVLIADISGFTKLASKLRLEELKYHINQYFSTLLGVIQVHKGDVIKFCGDSVLVIWPIPIDSDDELKKRSVIAAIACALDLLSTCGNYSEATHGGSEVLLNLHCGLSSGAVHCMCVGNTERMEFLIGGDQLKSLSSATSLSSKGELCLTRVTYDYITEFFPGISDRMDDFIKITPEDLKQRPLFLKTLSSDESSKKSRKAKLSTIYSIDQISDYGNSSPLTEETPLSKRPRMSSHSSSHSFRINSRSVDSYEPRSSGEYNLGIATGDEDSEELANFKTPHGSEYLSSTARKLLRIIIPGEERPLTPSLRGFFSRSAYFAKQLTSSTNEFDENSHSPLDSKDCPLIKISVPIMFRLQPLIHQSARKSISQSTSEYLGEIRSAVTVFIHLLEVDSALHRGDVDTVQKVFCYILDLLKHYCGCLRQFVFDDKGSVCICSFGIPGFSSTLDDVRAVYFALVLRDTLFQNYQIPCRIGVARGSIYCGYVGSYARKEYCVMGSSVNLAARLMSRAEDMEILTDSSVYYSVNHEFSFQSTSKIHIKGYASAVQVYKLIHAVDTRDMPPFSLTESYGINRIDLLLKRGSNQSVGRTNELKDLQDSLENFCSSQQCLREIDEINCREDELLRSNKYLIVGPEGFGKSYLLQATCGKMKKNFPVFEMFQIDCLLINICNSYEVIRQLLKSLFGSVVVESSVDHNSLGNDDEMIFNQISTWIKLYFADKYLSIPNMSVTATINTRLSNSKKKQKGFFRSKSNKIYPTILDSPTQIHEICDYSEETMTLRMSNASTLSPQFAHTILMGELTSLLRYVFSIPSLSSTALPPGILNDTIPKALKYFLLELIIQRIQEINVPFVLILENLQWIDQLSLDIVKDLISRGESFFFIGTIRPLFYPPECEVKMPSSW